MSSPEVEFAEIDSGKFAPELIERASVQLILLPEDCYAMDAKNAIYPSTTESTLKLLKSAKIPADLSVGNQDGITVRDNRSLEWAGPIIFVSQVLLTQNPDVLSLAIDAISNYVKELGRGSKDEPEAKLKIIYSSSGGKHTREIKYKGPASGLKDIPKTLAQLEKND